MENNNEKPKEIKKKETFAPLILLFSPRQRVRSILSAGLLQCNYQIILAHSAYVAALKASQFGPDLVIADITVNNTKDLLLITRFQKSIRTRNIAILITVPPEVGSVLEKTKKDTPDESTVIEKSSVHILQYPFNFSDLLKRIESILSYSGKSTQVKGREATTNDAIKKMLCDFQVSTANKFREIENTLQKQWAFPYTVIKALDIVDSNASCCDELGKCIETDLSATSAILKVVNTVFYAKRESRISKVKDAVVRLGFRETRNLLACMALINLSPEIHKKHGFSRREFWLHSLSTALIAEKLCVDCGYRRPELAFISGLIHDIGKIPLDINFESLFDRLLEDSASNCIPFYDAEERQMGFSHAALGHYLTTSWNFPSTITLSILHHHQPANIETVNTPIERILQSAVHVANILAKAMELGHSCDEVLEDIPQYLLKDLKINQGVQEFFFNSIYRNLNQLCKNLNISMKDIALAKTRQDEKDADVFIIFDNKIGYHPVISALKNNGYRVKVTNLFTADMMRQAKVAVFIPEKGSPIDITLNGNEITGTDGAGYLKIYLLDVMPKQDSEERIEEKDVIFFDRRNLEMQILLHTLDRYLGKVIVPEKEELADIDGIADKVP